MCVVHACALCFLSERLSRRCACCGAFCTFGSEAESWHKIGVQCQDMSQTLCRRAQAKHLLANETEAPDVIPALIVCN